MQNQIERQFKVGGRRGKEVRKVVATKSKGDNLGQKTKSQTLCQEPTSLPTVRLSACVCCPREWEGKREKKRRREGGQVHPTNCQTESESESKDEHEDEAELASNDRQDRMTFRGCCQLSLCCVFLFGFACVCSPHTHPYTHTHEEENFKYTQKKESPQ